ncbi:RNA polymerase sigma factor [Parvibaculum sp.]|jgi:RNA polymerase sigma-70 factor (ECF subfamily)|uniref:RNA polymerase sigma factor n=1 Tax=Parvibaculum sp. TaxID=2024848 RepID=UPI000C6C185C|nr:RNA polymerase sigma factor [Parvibaculum sp.]HAC60466.1 RNA polymerase subunit sigma [Rhodobiaceae bacterium]MAU60711.1 RNA polymerase subunit sigma [Parvibaculum sp.]MBO6667587.1 RNA polymerase sigma factor [Parvibaculum sp.]MBO6692149.1 RNA polymerase sigma factor [Parvibaculum sp.]MBO6714138.1 RNA polymerase sigma factor [Parvibaculum sp.]|tara:strand:+ start:622 stop:1140 length:519 start_codon:yes stop_codon:yes gene_type:complete
MDELEDYVEREIPHLRRFAHSLCGSAEEGDDLVQDALERAWRKRHSWRREGSIRGWLFRILYRVFLNSRRARKPAAADVDAESLADPANVRLSPQEARLTADDLRRGLEALPDEQRAAVLLVALEGVSYDEAASMLDVPIGTLRSRLFRGREALRRTMSDVERMPARLRRVK